MEKGELLWWSTSLIRLELFWAVVDVLNIVSIGNNGGLWYEPAHGVNEPLYRLLSHFKESVFHDELSSGQEFLELTKFIGLFADLIEGVPWSTKLLLDSWVFIEVSLDDILGL
jgi:hypothetical protein